MDLPELIAPYSKNNCAITITCPTCHYSYVIEDTLPPEKICLLTYFVTPFYYNKCQAITGAFSCQLHDNLLC